MSKYDILELSRENFADKNTVLRKKAEKVADFGDDTQVIIDNLIETMLSDKIAIGLSAPQVGISLQISVINLSKEEKDTLIIINPIVTSISGKKDKKKESCMSLPHFRGEVERRYNISIKYQDRYGNWQKKDAHGFFARVIAHEIDHVNGILYYDRMQNKNALEKVDFFNEKS